MKKKTIYGWFMIGATFLLLACHSGSSTEGDSTVEAITPVTITKISNVALNETTELTATSAFLLKTNVKANANGYLQKVYFKLGDFIKKGSTLFEIKTKEAMSLGNTINSLDTSFHFKGIITIKSPADGYLTSLDHQNGDYVMDGDQIATISDRSSFAFILNFPYELTQYLSANKLLKLILPDGSILDGTLDKAMPTMDVASQTQNFVIKVDINKMIPENLIAKVLLVKKSKTNATSIEKSAILSDETQREYWVMKLINDSTAVKVPVKIGMQGSERIEIIEPRFSESDKIILTGGYGLTDTATVNIIGSN